MNINIFLLGVTTLLLNEVIAQLGSRISGGTRAGVKQFPYAAAIHVQTQDDTFFCGGAFVRNQWIFTSAYCVSNATLFTVQLGSTSLTEDDTNRVTLTTSEYYVHPDFNPETNEHDIGLIKLKMPVASNEYVHVIGFDTYPVPEESELITYGWSQVSDSDSELSEHLQYVGVVVLSEEDCQWIYEDQITDNMFCARGNLDNGTCMGDNGAPVISREANMYFIVGVSRFIVSNGCENTNSSVFTRVAPYYNWIITTIKTNS